MKRDRSTVVVIDVQGKLADLMYERDNLYRQLQIFLRGVRALEIPTLWLEQYPQGLGPTAPEIAELLAGLQPIAKTSFSACGAEQFLVDLRKTEAETVFIVGIESHVCVYQTARDLLAAGFAVEVVSDAVSSRTESNCRLGLRRMAEVGTSITSVEMALFELLRDAKDPAFKEVARLVR
ncbi:MAG: isochorismatase family protein [Candidatus Latescibacterota bacterium]|nr:isochorismatase family protein [Candidatus Latescibacterota bacterium]